MYYLVPDINSITQLCDCWFKQYTTTTVQNDAKAEKMYTYLSRVVPNLSRNFCRSLANKIIMSYFKDRMWYAAVHPSILILTRSREPSCFPDDGY